MDNIFLETLEQNTTVIMAASMKADKYHDQEKKDILSSTASHLLCLGPSTQGGVIG